MELYCEEGLIEGYVKYFNLQSCNITLTSKLSEKTRYHFVPDLAELPPTYANATRVVKSVGLRMLTNSDVQVSRFVRDGLYVDALPLAFERLYSGDKLGKISVVRLCMSFRSDINMERDRSSLFDFMSSILDNVCAIHEPMFITKIQLLLTNLYVQVGKYKLTLHAFDSPTAVIDKIRDRKVMEAFRTSVDDRGLILKEAIPNANSLIITIPARSFNIKNADEHHITHRVRRTVETLKEYTVDELLINFVGSLGVDTTVDSDYSFSIPVTELDLILFSIRDKFLDNPSLDWLYIQPAKMIIPTVSLVGGANVVLTGVSAISKDALRNNHLTSVYYQEPGRIDDAYRVRYKTMLIDGKIKSIEVYNYSLDIVTNPNKDNYVLPFAPKINKSDLSINSCISKLFHSDFSDDLRSQLFSNCKSNPHLLENMEGLIDKLVMSYVGIENYSKTAAMRANALYIDSNTLIKLDAYDRNIIDKGPRLRYRQRNVMKFIRTSITPTNMIKSVVKLLISPAVGTQFSVYCIKNTTILSVFTRDMDRATRSKIYNACGVTQSMIEGMFETNKICQFLTKSYSSDKSIDALINIMYSDAASISLNMPVIMRIGSSFTLLFREFRMTTPVFYSKIKKSNLRNVFEANRVMTDCCYDTSCEDIIV